MAKYVLRDGHLIDKRTGECADSDPRAPISLPQVRGDLPAYRSPITGEVVDGRAARREDLARHGCREIDPSEWKPEYRNEKYRLANWRADRERNGPGKTYFSR